MARSRNLKPGFFKNEDLAACGMTARVLFAGLWCFADRMGRLDDRPKRIKAEVFPYDTVDVDAELSELDRAGFICRYEKNGTKYIQINNFTKHQNPHIKEQDSTIPAPDKHQASTGNSGTCPADSLNPITDSLNPIKPLVETHVSTAVPFEEILNLYHQSLPELPRCIKLTKQRKGYIRQRWQEDFPDLDSWETFFGYVRQSKFLMGKAPPRNGGEPFRATLDWLCKPENCVKVVEKKYG